MPLLAFPLLLATGCGPLLDVPNGPGGPMMGPPGPGRYPNRGPQYRPGPAPKPTPPPGNVFNPGGGGPNRTPGSVPGGGQNPGGPGGPGGGPGNPGAPGNRPR